MQPDKVQTRRYYWYALCCIATISIDLNFFLNYAYICQLCYVLKVYSSLLGFILISPGGRSIACCTKYCLVLIMVKCIYLGDTILQYFVLVQ